MGSGLVFHIQRYCIQDGPGIRTTVFLKGCPASCWWCHNPESQSPRPEILVLRHHCQSCGTCLTVCPSGYLTSTSAERRSQGLDCTRCGTCAQACPSDARRLVGRPMTVAEVVAEVTKDRIFFDDSGGGVTISGGEPLTQFPFLRDLLAALRAEEIHTAVDTCGYTAREHLLAIAPLTDLFLYDVKLVDEERHHFYTGISNRPVIENLRALGEVHGNLWIRVPLIAGINDDRANIEATAALVAATPGVQRVELLPYHATGQPKLERLGRPGPPEGLASPSREAALDLAECFRGHGLLTYLRNGTDE